MFPTEKIESSERSAIVERERERDRILTGKVDS